MTPIKPKRGSQSYEAVLDLVCGDHWVAVYRDGRNRLNIRMVSDQDAWDKDVQKNMVVEVVPKPHNRCQLKKVVNRPY